MGRAMTRDTGGQHSGKRVCDAGLKESRKAAELIFDEQPGVRRTNVIESAERASREG
jgi:hypothetical protein